MSKTLKTKLRSYIWKQLLKLAEQQAKLNDVNIIGIEFDKEESESFVLNWYLRNGYKLFSKRSKLLIKEL